MPGSDEWEKARDWDDLVMVENFGTKYLFVNSYDAAVDLFEKRGFNYSTRPRSTMLELWVDSNALYPVCFSVLPLVGTGSGSRPLCRMGTNIESLGSSFIGSSSKRLCPVTMRHRRIVYIIFS